jgi:hypothetical protein
MLLRLECHPGRRTIGAGPSDSGLDAQTQHVGKPLGSEVPDFVIQDRDSSTEFETVRLPDAHF